MALHSISEAARVANKARSTIHRHIKEGKLSKVLGADGRPAIETSELHRVYRDLSHKDSSDTPISVQADTPQKTVSTVAMEAELAALRTERDYLKEERDRWVAQSERLTLLLTHDGQAAGGKPARRAGWFDRLLGRT